MKQTLFLLSLLISFLANSQTPYVPNNPDSIKLAVTVANAVRSVLVVDLTKNKVNTIKHTADSAALKMLIDGNTSRINAPLGTLPSYEGLVATRGLAADNKNASSTKMNSRTPHFATQDITTLKIAIPNWYLAGSGTLEIGTGSTATVTASVEYPSGTFTQIKFAGSISGSIPDLTTLVSDYANVTIPKYALFWVRIFFVNTGGILYNQVNPTANLGSGQTNGGTAADQTMSGTITSDQTTFSPVAIIGQTTNPSVVFVGDSRTFGVNDLTADLLGNYGNIAKVLGINYGYTSLSRASQTMVNFLASRTNQTALFAYASHVISAYGYNDIWGNSVSSATAIANSILFQNIVKAAGKKVINVTIGPKTSSTDSWATTANQTVASAGNNTTKTAYNTWVRNGGNGQDGYLDINLHEEDYLDSGKWRVNGLANYYTSDGIHENTTMNLLLKAVLRSEMQLLLGGSLK